MKQEKNIQSALNKIAFNITKIKNIFNKQNSIIIDSNINKSRQITNDNGLNINETESNKRNEFGFPIIHK